MASIVLGAAGSYFAGPVGGMIGSAIGGIIDQHLFGPKDVRPPQLIDTKVTSATFGQPIPRVYGTTRVGCNLIQSSDLIQHSVSQKAPGSKGGLFGGSKQTTYQYTATFAVAIAAGPLTAIWRVWADGQVIYDARPTSIIAAEDIANPQTGTATLNSGRVVSTGVFQLSSTTTGLAYGSYMTFYLGTETQMPDPNLEALTGAGNCPAYRGTGYIVFANFPVSDFGNRIPSISCEVVGLSNNRPQLSFNDQFQAADTTSLSALTASLNSPQAVDQFGNMIAWDGSNKAFVVGINQAGQEVWRKTTTQIVADMTGAGLPSFTGTSGLDSIGTVCQGAYMVGMYAIRAGSMTGYPDQSFNIFFMYQLNQSSAPTFIGFVIYENGIGLGGSLAVGSFQNYCSTGLGQPTDPIVAVGLAGLGSHDELMCFFPSPATMLAGGPLSKICRAVYVGQGMPLSCFFPVPYLTTASMPTIGTKLVVFVPHGAYNSGGSTAVGYSAIAAAHPNGYAAYIDLGDVSDISGSTLQFINVNSYTGFNLPYVPADYTSNMSALFPLPSDGLFLSTGNTGSTDSYNPMPAMNQIIQGELLYGWVMPGDQDAASNRGNTSELAAVLLSAYNPVTQQWSVYAEAIGEIYKNTDFGTMSTAGFKNNQFCIYTSNGSATTTAEFILGGAMLVTSSAASGACYWTVLGGVNGVWGCTLDLVTSDIAERCGLPATTLDVLPLGSQVVQGYCITHQMPGRTAIEALQQFFFYDMIESDWTLKGRFRQGTPIGSIAFNDLGSRQDNTEQDVTTNTNLRQPPQDLPREIVVKYMLPQIDYQTATQQAKRPLAIVNALSQQSYDFAITAQPGDAKAVAVKALYLAWIQRQSHQLDLPRTIMQYDPGDVLTLNFQDLDNNALSVPFYLQTIDFGTNDLFKVTGVETDAILFSNTQPASLPLSTGRPANNVVQPVNLILFDGPLLDDSANTPGFYAAAYGTVNGAWTGGPLTKSLDGGSTFSQIDTFISNDQVGQATTSLPSPPKLDYSRWDTTNSVIITMKEPYFTLVSASPEEVLNGANYAMLGSELIGYCNVTPITSTIFKLSLLRRGVQGTDTFMGNHKVGENFIPVVNGVTLSETLQLSEYNIGRVYQGYSFGTNPANIGSTTFASQFTRMKCLAPVNGSFSRDGSNNITLTWTPRRRLSDDIVDGMDQYVDESPEAYSADVLSLPTSTLDPAATSPQLVFTDPMHLFRAEAVTQPTTGNYASSLTTLGANGTSLLYAEFSNFGPTSGLNTLIGLVQGTFSLTAGVGLETGVTNFGLAASGLFYQNGVVAEQLFSYTGGMTVGLAWNQSAGHIWFTYDGIHWNNDFLANQNPVGNIGGIGWGTTAYLGGSVLQQGLGFTINTGYLPFTFTPPTGFSAWSGVPTKLRTITASSPTLSYTAAQQTADGLTPGNAVSLNVYQISGTTLQRGYPGQFYG